MFNDRRTFPQVSVLFKLSQAVSAGTLAQAAISAEADLAGDEGDGIFRCGRPAPGRDNEDARRP